MGLLSKIFFCVLTVTLCGCAFGLNRKSAGTSASSESAAADIGVSALSDSVVSSTNYAKTLAIIEEYAFHQQLIAGHQNAIDWLTSNELSHMNVFSDEENTHQVDFEILEADENVVCAFHFEYSVSGDYKSYRHIFQGIKEAEKDQFIHDLKIWYVAASGLSDVAAKCFSKTWGATGYVWELRRPEGIVQHSIHRNAADFAYPWIEIRQTSYKDVADKELVDCGN